jgi:hypothetical protein
MQSELADCRKIVMPASGRVPMLNMCYLLQGVGNNIAVFKHLTVIIEREHEWKIESETFFERRTLFALP